MSDTVTQLKDDAMILAQSNGGSTETSGGASLDLSNLEGWGGDINIELGGALEEGLQSFGLVIALIAFLYMAYKLLVPSQNQGGSFFQKIGGIGPLIGLGLGLLMFIDIQVLITIIEFVVNVVFFLFNMVARAVPGLSD